MAKTAKTRIFLDTTLPLNDSKQLSQVSDQVLDKSDVRMDSLIYYVQNASFCNTKKHHVTFASVNL